MPDVDIPVVTIQTIYPGAGPQEVETQVTKKTRGCSFNSKPNRCNDFIFS